MFSNLSNLLRYRGLISSLVARELKARYRGSVLGFVWSFVNPLLLLLIYSFVFTTVMPNTTEGVQPYQLFMFCGILPWTWFSSSLAESANSLIAGGNLIKKVLFPAERPPVPPVLRHQPVHASGGVVPGDPVLQPGAGRTLEMAGGLGCPLDSPVPRGLLAVRSPARFVRGGGVIMATKNNGHKDT